jgi:homeodomain interacting protein kinase
VPSWPQQAAPHSLIVDSAPFVNVEEFYPKHHLNMQSRHEPKKESPVHHLVYGSNAKRNNGKFEHSLMSKYSSVPRHDKKESNQLSPVKKRVKENTPPHQRYNNRSQHQCQQYHDNGSASSSSSFYNNSNLVIFQLFFYLLLFL